MFSLFKKLLGYELVFPENQNGRDLPYPFKVWGYNNLMLLAESNESPYYYNYEVNSFRRHSIGMIWGSCPLWIKKVK